MYLIQTETEIEKVIVDLILEKQKLEGKLEEINRALGYMPEEHRKQRKVMILKRLEEVESILKQKPMEPIAPVAVKQFFVTTG